jgi:hypothetical protein
MITLMNGIRNSSLSRMDLHFVVSVEDFALVQAQGLNDVLVGVGVNGFFKGLAKQKLAALGGCDVTVCAQDNVVGSQAVGSHEKAEIALDNATLVFGQTIRVFPQWRCRGSC